MRRRSLGDTSSVVMRLPYALACALALLAGCRNDSTSARPSPARNARPRNVAAARDVPTATAAASDAAAAAATPADEDAGAEPATGVGVYRLGESNCVRDPARNTLGASVHGFFSGSRLEMEVRNIRFSCTPAPTFSADVEGGVVRMRYRVADRAALGRCACRHDSFLQVTGIPTGEYEVRVEELPAGDGGAQVVATGRIVSTPAGGGGSSSAESSAAQ